MKDEIEGNGREMKTEDGGRRKAEGTGWRLNETDRTNRTEGASESKESIKSR